MVKNIFFMFAFVSALFSCGRKETNEHSSTIKNNNALCQFQKWGEYNKSVAIFGTVFTSTLSSQLVDFKNLNLQNSEDRYMDFTRYVANHNNGVRLEVQLKIKASNFAISTSRGRLRDLFEEKADEAFKSGGLEGEQYTYDREGLKTFLNNFISSVRKDDFILIQLDKNESKITINNSTNNTFKARQKDFLHKFTTPLVTDSSDAKKAILSKIIDSIAENQAHKC